MVDRTDRRAPSGVAHAEGVLQHVGAMGVSAGGRGVVNRDEHYVTQREAATLCGCDYTTIRRHRERGQLPGARRRDDANGTWEIPVADLVAGGFWRPVDGEDADAGAVLGRTKAERLLEEARREIERAEARIEALTAALADRRNEVAYLRRALDAALAVRARVVA